MEKEFTSLVTRALYVGFSEQGKGLHLATIRNLFIQHPFRGSKGNCEKIIIGLDFLAEEDMPPRIGQRGFAATRCTFSRKDNILMVEGAVSKRVVGQSEVEFRNTISILLAEVGSKLTSYCVRKQMQFSGAEYGNYLTTIIEQYSRIELPLGPSDGDMDTVAYHLGLTP